MASKSNNGRRHVVTSATQPDPDNDSQRVPVRRSSVAEIRSLAFSIERMAWGAESATDSSLPAKEAFSRIGDELDVLICKLDELSEA